MGVTTIPIFQPRTQVRCVSRRAENPACRPSAPRPLPCSSGPSPPPPRWAQQLAFPPPPRLRTSRPDAGPTSAVPGWGNETKTTFPCYFSGTGAWAGQPDPIPGGAGALEAPAGPRHKLYTLTLVRRMRRPGQNPPWSRPGQVNHCLDEAAWLGGLGRGTWGLSFQKAEMTKISASQSQHELTCKGHPGGSVG